MIYPSASVPATVSRARHCICFAPHALTALGNVAPVVALAQLVSDPAIVGEAGDSSSFAMLFNGVAALANALGKVLTAPLVDAAGAPYLIAAILAMAVSLAAFALAPSEVALLACWASCNICLSGSWAAESKAIEATYHRERWPIAFGLLTNTSLLIRIGARVGLGALLSAVSWRVMCISVALTLGAAVFIIVPLFAAGQLRSGRTQRNGGPCSPSGVEICLDPPIVLYAVAMAGATCVQRMENLVAVVLVQCAHLSASDAAMQSALFHVAVFATISIVTPFYSGLGVRSKAVLMIGLNALGCACIVCLVHLTSASSQALHNSRAWYALALNGLLAAAGSCFALLYYVSVSVFSLSHGDASARVLALLNAAGQAGGFLFQVGAAYLFSIGYGWSEVLGGLAGCATLATLCTALAEMSAER